jgi:hypothetical protein
VARGDDDTHPADREDALDAVPSRDDVSLANRRIVSPFGFGTIDTYAHLNIESRRMRHHEQPNPPK